ncbi:hypothetical protein ASNO1_56850 [Corallococcus caeni]|uniref:Uncharacterized protein n=1 Tax=Corallococcus caeni TaxID=3082388 RepID=A0ABQ6QZL1_9BACT|nr:hypothetical protein ASNO1_56850 [Corallococcus sp. NO1]
MRTLDVGEVRRKRTDFSSGVMRAPTGRPFMKRPVSAYWRRKDEDSWARTGIPKRSSATVTNGRMRD